MKIEEEIKQKKFKDDYQKATINIIFTANWLMSHQIRFLKPYGISPQQYNILRILKGQHPNPAPLKLLTERMIDRMSNTSRLVEKLRQKNMVERKVCSDNRRQVDIMITKQGLDLVDQVAKGLDKDIQNSQHLSISEARQISDLLDKMRG